MQFTLVNNCLENREPTGDNCVTCMSYYMELNLVGGADNTLNEPLSGAIRSF